MLLQYTKVSHQTYLDQGPVIYCYITKYPKLICLKIILLFYTVSEGQEFG